MKVVSRQMPVARRYGAFHLGRGPASRTEPLAREAIALVLEQMVNLRADILLELAQVWRTRNEKQEGTLALEEEVRLYELKGNVVSSEQPQRRSSSAPR